MSVVAGIMGLPPGLPRGTDPHPIPPQLRPQSHMEEEEGALCWEIADTTRKPDLSYNSHHLPSSHVTGRQCLESSIT
ncbi:hypothetical protein GDO81_025974 [Engystomops pustulosus]|uniref:Uncharacterized protein n=1 Tax=Engystomops pustulosus TaxID=76066 RepID=A0AAV6Z132_ENGPU|nr:hypothetical protein GDO81_025974 [Engystomops pustulosus]